MARTGSGIEVRGNSIRIKIEYGNRTIRERLTLDGRTLEATPANIKYAHRLAQEIRRRIAQGTFELAEYFPDSKQLTPADTPTLGKLADLWLQSKGRLSEATKDQYATSVRFWKRLLGADTPIKDINHKLLVSKIGAYPWPSAATHNNYMISLRGILKLEYRGPTALHNPIAGIENMKVVRKLPDPMSTVERDSILEHMQKHYDERIYAYFLWMFFTGMRPEEAIALRWSDIDTRKQVARVQRVRTFRGSERDGSKTHSERDVDLLPQAMDALTIMKSHTFMLRVEREGEEDTSADIFQNPVTGKPWHDERSQREHYWKPTLKRLGIRWRKAYNTRHTFATAALMAGVPAAYIANQIGNSVKMLLEKYARWIPGSDNGNARAILMAAMAGKKEEFVPNSSQSLNWTGLKMEKIHVNQGLTWIQIGRRDWTRTNDPHHVKVVL